MIKYERQNIILDQLLTKGTISLSDLVKKFDNPKLTIQRDLKELEEQGKLTRVHGGAVSKKGFSPIPKSVRGKKNIDIKRELAKKAASMITEHDTVAIDPSTTCSFIADYLPDYSINVLTPSIETFMKLSLINSVTPILPGGTINHKSQNLIGSFADDTISKLNFSLCFISADGLNPESGSLEFDYDDSLVKHSMINNSAKVILLIDSTKLSRNKGIFTCSIYEIDTIIMDKNSIIKNWPEKVKNKIIYV